MQTLKFLAKGLFSNSVIINDSKKQKWWLAIIVMILSIILSIIPTFTSITNFNGGDIITKNSALQIDYSLQRFSSEYLNGNDAKLVFNIRDKKLVMVEGKSIDDLQEKKTVTLKDGTNLSYLEIGRTIEDKKEITLLVSYVKYDAEKEKATYANLSEKSEDVFNRLAINYDIKDEKGESTSTSKTYSSLIFFEESVTIRLYDSKTVEYEFDENKNVSLKKIKAFAVTGLYSAVSQNNANLNLFYNEDPDIITSKWEEFFTESYNPIKTQSLLMQTSVYSGINLIIILIMSLTLFIMTRFKSSVCGKQSYGTCLKLISFSALCPSILCLMAGFMLPSLQSFAFLTFVGLRSIFLSTRLTRGEIAQAPAK